MRQLSGNSPAIASVAQLPCAVFAGLAGCTFWLAAVAGAQAPSVRYPGPAVVDAAQGEVVAAVTLEELQALALHHHPGLGQKLAELEAARGRWTQAGLYPNPTAGYTGSEIGNEGRAGQQGFLVQQEFVTGGKLRLDRAVNHQEVMRLEQVARGQELRVLNDVRLHYVDVLVAQQSVKLARQLVELGERGLQTTSALFQAQEVSRTDVLQARIEWNSARILLANTENQLTGAWRRLAAVCGVPDLPAAPLRGGLAAQRPAYVYEDFVAAVLQASPELAAAQIAVGRAQLAVERAGVEPLPNITLAGQLQHDNSSADDVAQFNFSFPLPVYNRNQGNIAAARGELRAAQAAAARVELQLRHRMARTFERYVNAGQQVERYEQQLLPDSREALELVASGYRQGEFSYLVLLTSQRTYIQTHLAYLSALRDLRSAEVEIEGLLLTESLGQDGG